MKKIFILLMVWVVILGCVFLFFLDIVASAEPELPGYPDYKVWFPLVFNEAEHPEYPDPTPTPEPIPTPTLVPGCVGYSYLPGYEHKIEYPKSLAGMGEGDYIVTCYNNPGCKLGSKGSNGYWFYYKNLSPVSLAGDVTVLVTDFRYNNSRGDTVVVLTQDMYDGNVFVTRVLMPLEQRLYPGGTYLIPLPPDIEPGQANGIGLFRVSDQRLVDWITFPPCRPGE